MVRQRGYCYGHYKGGENRMSLPRCARNDMRFSPIHLLPHKLINSRNNPD
jgi:hypothetical protein